MNHHINFRSATAPRVHTPAGRATPVHPPKSPSTGKSSGRPSGRNWRLPVGLAVVAGAAVVGLVVQTTASNNLEGDTPIDVTDVRIDAASERPSDLVVSGWYTTRTHDQPALESTRNATDTERPGDLVVSGSNVTRVDGTSAPVRRISDTERPGDLVVAGWSTSRTHAPAIENTATTELNP